MLIHGLPEEYQDRFKLLAERWGVTSDRLVCLFMDLGLAVLEAAAQRNDLLPDASSTRPDIGFVGRDPND